MSVIRHFQACRRAVLTAVGGCILSAIAGSSTLAAPPLYPDMLPLSKVKEGMKGYGLTTFHGTTISKFEVTVIGILKKANSGHDLILVRMKGGPITERGANLIHGMSGSPIYLDGKVAGAFSMGEQFPKEPIGMVTPIEDMLEAWDPNIPQQPNYYLPADAKPMAPSQGGQPTVKKSAKQVGWKTPNTSLSFLPVNAPTSERTITLPHPIMVGDRRIAGLVLNARPDDTRRSTDSVAVMHRATSMMSVSGISASGLIDLQKEMDRRGYAVTVMRAPGAAGKQASGFKGAPLHPGSAFGTWLATGDFEFGGTGTVTYRHGNKILAFGHPLLGLGALDAAISSAYVLDVFPGYDSSHHIAVPGPIIGTLRQDTDFSVSGEIGHMPKMIPMDVTIRDRTTLRTKTFHTNMFEHPDLTAVLLGIAAKSLITQVHDTPGDVMAYVTTTVDAGEVGKITRSNEVFDSVGNIGSVATSDLTDITNIVSGNPFYPLPIKSASMTVDITSGHNTATIERIFLRQGKYEPGDKINIGVMLKPYRREAIVRDISLKIPSDIPSGRYALVVRGGTPIMSRLGSFMIGGSSEAQTPPVNVRQMVARLNEHERNTDMVARLVLNSAAPAVEGERLSQLPPNLAALMNSARNSGVRLERDELRTTSPTDYVVSGMQQLIVTVQKKNNQEPVSSSNFSMSPGSSIPGLPSRLDTGSSSLSGASVSEDDATSEAGSRENMNASPLTLGAETLRWLNSINSTGIDSSGKDSSKYSMDAALDDPQIGAAQTPVQPSKTRKGRAAKDKTDQTATTTPTTVTAAPVTPPPAATAPDTTNDKPVGRPLQIWRQTSKTDFAAGKFMGSSVDALGDLRIASRLRRLAGTGETYIWSLMPDDKGNIYAGTGTGGKILKIDAQGQVSTFATLPIVSVQSMLLAKDGSIWAGSGVKGNVYRVDPSGHSMKVCTLPEKYILALAQDSKGNIYIGPGGGGTVYKIDAGSDFTKPVTPTSFLKTNADHIMALAMDGSDNLYVGLGAEGALYKVAPDGKSSVIFDAKENSITALTVDSKGNVYAGTGPKGMLYRIAPDGAVATLYDRSTSFYTGLKTAQDGTVYASTVNSIYHIVPSSSSPTQVVVQPLDNPVDIDFLTLATLPSGGAIVGTGNVGEIYTSVPETSGAPNRTGTFESVVHDARLTSRWGTAHVTADTPRGSSVQIETRTGMAADPDVTWSDWSVARKIGANEAVIASPPARFIQYRLTLNAAVGSDKPVAMPVVHEVVISYMSRNQAPRVMLQAPLGGERWSKTQTVRWSGSDPDNDTLTYDLFYSTDGVNWNLLPADKAVSGTSSSSASGSSTLSDTQKKLDAQPGVPDSIKKMVLDSAQQRLSGGNAYSGVGSLKTTTKNWDTSTLPDGSYQIKVVATDRVSNPVDFLTATATSEPFIICNTPPTLQPLKLAVGADRTVSLDGEASQTMIAITAVQYRVDGGDWIAAIPKAGLFATPQAGFSVHTLPLTSGKHTIEIEVFNAAGNKTAQNMDVTVP